MRTSRRRFLAACLAVPPGLLLTGCAVPRRQEGAAHAADPDEATLVVGAADGQLPARFLGLSYEKGDLRGGTLFHGGNTELAHWFDRLGPGNLRIGGNSADRTGWKGIGGIAGRSLQPSDVDALAAFVRLTSWNVLYGLNLATSTPQAAADEAAHAASRLGDRLAAFEIGNECDLYGKHYFPDWTLTRFEQRWADFRAAILARVPGAVLSGPASATHVKDWTVPFALGRPGGEIALLTQHYYAGNGKDPRVTVAELLGRDGHFRDTVCMPLHHAARARGIPFRLGEINSLYDGGRRGISDRFASALWVLQAMTTLAACGGAGVNLHGGNRGAYTPIANVGGTVLGPRPIYGGLLLFAQLGAGEQHACHWDRARPAIHALAVAGRDGLRTLLLNTDPQRALRVAVRLPGEVAALQINGIAATPLDAQTVLPAELGQVRRDADGAFRMNLPANAAWVLRPAHG